MNESDSEMVGITNQNRVNQKDKYIGTSFKRKDHILGDAIWSIFAKVSQSNSRFNAMDTLVVTAHSVGMPMCISRGIKSMCRPLSDMAHLKRSIVEVKATENFWLMQ